MAKYRPMLSVTDSTKKAQAQEGAGLDLGMCSPNINFPPGDKVPSASAPRFPGLPALCLASFLQEGRTGSPKCPASVLKMSIGLNAGSRVRMQEERWPASHAGLGGPWGSVEDPLLLCHRGVGGHLWVLRGPCILQGSLTALLRLQLPKQNVGIWGESGHDTPLPDVGVDH